MFALVAGGEVAYQLTDRAKEKGAPSLTIVVPCLAACVAVGPPPDPARPAPPRAFARGYAPLWLAAPPVDATVPAEQPQPPANVTQQVLPRLTPHPTRCPGPASPGLGPPRQRQRRPRADRPLRGPRRLRARRPAPLLDPGPCSRANRARTTLCDLPAAAPPASQMDASTGSRFPSAGCAADTCTRPRLHPHPGRLGFIACSGRGTHRRGRRTGPGRRRAEQEWSSCIRGHCRSGSRASRARLRWRRRQESRPAAPACAKPGVLRDRRPALRPAPRAQVYPVGMTLIAFFAILANVEGILNM